MIEGYSGQQFGILFLYVGRQTKVSSYLMVITTKEFYKAGQENVIE